MKIMIDLSDEETKSIWEAAAKAKAEVEVWPAWKRGEDRASTEFQIEHMRQVYEAAIAWRKAHTFVEVDAAETALADAIDVALRALGHE